MSSEKNMLVEDDHEDMSSDEEDTNAAQAGAVALLKVSLNNLFFLAGLKLETNRLLLEVFPVFK